MASESKCLKCGAPLTSDARHGVCPKCLLGQALAREETADRIDTSSLTPCQRCATATPSAELIEGLCPQCLILAMRDLNAQGAQNVVAEARSAMVTGTAATEEFGDRIGCYKILERIGEGGWGIVFLAEQDEPIRRRVALKVLKLGMDTKEVVARFEAERQALALMDHPNIARIFDGGATSTGRPFFVMELVRGIRITEFCDEKNLSTQQRLELFMQVCQAVQHAHQKGVIHRDLKPSNILVTVNDGVAVPKVIDFGIAKATGQRLTDKTFHTRFHQLIGTPAYMSPEQVEMTSVDIDTRSDIYSLGVLLYELLTGHPPFDPKELFAAGVEAMIRTIREKEPLRPSNRLNTMADKERTTTAQRRGVDAPKLVHLVRGDLDWVVMKCLEKDRARRYETANGLVRDLQRHLNHEPIVARPPSTSYRLQKFVRRNQGLVTATAVLTVVLIAGVVVSAWQWRTAVEARQLADQQRLTTRQRLYAADVRLAQDALGRC